MELPDFNNDGPPGRRECLKGLTALTVGVGGGILLIGPIPDIVEAITNNSSSYETVFDAGLTMVVAGAVVGLGYMVQGIIKGLRNEMGRYSNG